MIFADNVTILSLTAFLNKTKLNLLIHLEKSTTLNPDPNPKPRTYKQRQQPQSISTPNQKPQATKDHHVFKSYAAARSNGNIFGGTFLS
jgi:hypothetical protein